MNRAHRQSTRILAATTCGLGVAMIVTTVARGGGALAFGIVLGVAFVALGAGGCTSPAIDEAAASNPVRALVRPVFVSIEGRLARVVGTPAIYAIAVSAIGASIYVTLGIVADRALALTPLAYVTAGIFFVVTMLTYVEGNSLPSGAWRRLHVRPLRIRRAVELHRRLGDRPRLPDRDGAVRVRDPGLPGGLLGAPGRQRRRARDRGCRDRVGGLPQSPRPASGPARPRAPARRAQRLAAPGGHRGRVW